MTDTLTFSGPLGCFTLARTPGSTFLYGAGLKLLPPAGRPQPPNDATAAAARSAFQATVQRYVEAFGAQCGTQYAADGLTFEQATARHAEFVTAVRLFGEITAAKEATAKLQAQLAPAVGAGVAKFAAGLKLPK